MAITIRRAESRDLDKTLKLLSEVLELHAKILNTTIDSLFENV